MKTPIKNAESKINWIATGKVHAAENWRKESREDGVTAGPAAAFLWDRAEDLSQLIPSGHREWNLGKCSLAWQGDKPSENPKVMWRVPSIHLSKFLSSLEFVVGVLYIMWWNFFPWQ